MKIVLAVLFLATVASSLDVPAPGNVLFCDICIDIVTDIDEVRIEERNKFGVDIILSVSCQRAHRRGCHWIRIPGQPLNNVSTSFNLKTLSQICDALGSIVPDFVATCRALIAAQVPTIIEGLVEDNLNPQQICDGLGACPWCLKW